MSSQAATVPSPADILCESCGYTLNGLPADGRCPECGSPVADSTANSGRTLPAWETHHAFWQTTAQVIFRTTRFYRTLRTRAELQQHRAAYAFALRHWFLAAFLIAVASASHYTLADAPVLAITLERRLLMVFLWVGLVTAVAGLGIMALTHVAAWLTAWEAGWRGYRLPGDAVLRALCYHAAQLLPFSALLLLVVLGYRALWIAGVAGPESLVTYLAIVSTVAVGGVLFLFWTYWIGMRNMLFANE